MYHWTRITQAAAFAPRDGAGALTHQGRMWLIGGWNPDDKTHFPSICSNDVWCSTDGRDWQCVKPNTFGHEAFDPAGDWEGRHTAGYVVHQNKLWIVGGDANQGHYQNDVWHSEDGIRWDCVCRGDNLPWRDRVLHHVVAFQDYIWVMGGQTLPGFAHDGRPTKIYDDLWRSRDGATWEKVTPAGKHWSPRGMIGGHVVLHDRLWLLGGGTYDTPDRNFRDFYHDVWSSPDGVHWQCELPQAPWPARQYHEVAAFDGRMWVLEGYDGKANRNDVWHSPDGVNWTDLPDTPWAPRHAASVFVHDHALWMVTGNNMQSDVWRLDRD